MSFYSHRGLAPLPFREQTMPSSAAGMDWVTGSVQGDVGPWVSELAMLIIIFSFVTVLQ